MAPANVDRNDLCRRTWLLYRDLEAIAGRDAEQEVQGMAIPVIDAVITAARDELGEDPITGVIADLFSPNNVEMGEPQRAADLMIVVGQLARALGPERPRPPVSAF